LGIEDTILSRPAGASDQVSGKAGEFQVSSGSSVSLSDGGGLTLYSPVDLLGV
jgi:hypothetical protein